MEQNLPEENNNVEQNTQDQAEVTGATPSKGSKILKRIIIFIVAVLGVMFICWNVYNAIMEYAESTGPSRAGVAVVVPMEIN